MIKCSRLATEDQHYDKQKLTHLSNCHFGVKAAFTLLLWKLAILLTVGITTTLAVKPLSSLGCVISSEENFSAITT